MLTLSCDKCDRSFAVDPAAVGPKVTCPYCGDVQRRPGSTPAAGPGPAGAPAGDGLNDPHPASAAAAATAGAPLPPRDGPEVLVIRSTPTMFRSYPLRFAGLVLGAVVGPVMAAYIGWAGQGPAKAVLAWGMLAIGVLAIATLIGWKVWSLTERLEITTRRIRFTRGLIARSSVEMLHRSVQDIEIEQTVWQRLLRTGTIRVANAGEEEDDIEIKDVPNPHRLRDLIDQYR
jgi:membrane protein YdbS with pleckstrin-like domain